MATLNSPGVQVSVIDESFYTPAAPGTVPLMFVTCSSNKTSASGVSTAVGTLDANVGRVWSITSQRDLADTFGVPYFETDANGNPVNGGELNEYGLQAAYSLLGVSSQAYIVRAGVDTGQLFPQADPPNGDPANGTYWVDTDNTVYGVTEWNKTNAVFVSKTPLIIDNDNKDTAASLSGDEWTPNASFGTVGSYVIVVTSENTNALWYKNSDNVWVKVGTNEETNFGADGWTSSVWASSWPVVLSTGFGTVSTATTQVTVNSSTFTVPANPTPATFSAAFNIAGINGVGSRVVGGKAYLYSDATAASNGSTKDGKIVLSDVTTGALGRLGLTTGTYGGVALAVQPHTQVPQYAANNNASGSVYVKTTVPNNGANWAVKYYNGATKTWGSVSAPMYATGEAAIYAFDKGGGVSIPAGTLYIEYNYDHGTGANDASPKFAEFKVYRRNAVSPTTISYIVPSSFTAFPATTSTFFLKETTANSSAFSTSATITLSPGASLTAFVTAVSAAGLTNVSASYNTSSRTLSISHALGGDIKILDGTNAPLTGGGSTKLAFTAFNMSTGAGTPNLYAAGDYESDGFTLKASNFKPLVFEAKANAPYQNPTDGALWFSNVVDDVDILYHNGTTWVGYKTEFPSTDPSGPQVKAVAPTTQSDGTALVDGDIWISTANIDNYGQAVYVWNATTLKWIEQDVTDQVTPNGWLFADARWATTGQAELPSSIVDLLSSDYLDPDAPDPALYPEGMRLWNLRRSGYNVKKYVVNYIDIEENLGINPRYTDTMNGVDPYFANRWISASPNNANGSGTFGRHAQRGVIVKELKSVIDTNQTVRDTDTLTFNLIACPGYPELVQNMISFNTDRKETAFVVGDTPFRLEATGTALAEWGNNTNGATDNGDLGAVSYSPYMAFYYPSGLTNDNFGNTIVVPPSHMMIRTIARSDAVSFPWFAPAGIRRGTVDNATSVGYIDSQSGEFQRVSLYEGLRDVMAQNGKINPIAVLPGSGIVAMGQYTRALGASALDRINVSRLVAYLRRQLEILARPFLFEPNDNGTREEIKNSAESLLLELVSQRGLYDFVVVCDESNNTPARIDRNELWMDIAIEPVKSVEFIYIPLRLVNTGEISTLG
jgi:hypothetical protein